MFKFQNKFYLFFIAYISVFIVLLIYSYSQIDLNLTLSSSLVYQNIQQQLIQLGYFNRQFSTGIFVGIITLLFILYGTSLWFVKKGNVSKKQLFFLIGASIALLFLSYPAFSHDFFNYIFDARIIVKYGQNPYIHKALDYQGDLWIRFMRWTHRTYPYGPLWLVVTVPFYAIGFGKFTLTLLSFKTLFVAVYLGNALLIYKINSVILTQMNIGGRIPWDSSAAPQNDKKAYMSHKNALLAVSFYALNPLILIESIVSPHLDSLMLFFLLVGLYFFLQGKKAIGVIGVIGSAGIKFVTGVLLALFVFFQKKDFQKIVTYGAWLFLLALIVPIVQREPYPWYFIPVIGLAALSNSRFLKLLVTGISLGALLRYAPFLYFGDYADTTKTAQLWLTVVPVALFIILSIVYTGKKRLLR